MWFCSTNHCKSCSICIVCLISICAMWFCPHFLVQMVLFHIFVQGGFCSMYIWAWWFCSIYSWQWFCSTFIWASGFVPLIRVSGFCSTMGGFDPHSYVQSGVAPLICMGGFDPFTPVQGRNQVFPVRSLISISPVVTMVPLLLPLRFCSSILQKMIIFRDELLIWICSTLIQPW